MIDKRTIDKVIEASDIVAVVSDFVELKKKGARYLGLCPFHDDRHIGNFSVYPTKNVFKCFACDAKGGPVEFVMRAKNVDFPDAIRYLGKKFKIEVDGADGIDVEPAERRTPPPPLPTLYLPKSMVDLTMRRDSTFHRWLRSLPWSSDAAARLDVVIDEYHVGATKQGFVVFWQIDETGDGVRTGHCMRYHEDGHRCKERGYNVDWIDAMLKRETLHTPEGDVPRYSQYQEDKVECRKTLFGMHLLDKYPNAEVHIVESEKTALICAIYFGNSAKDVWMACAGKWNLTEERLAPIIKRRRQIALHPDKDGREEWQTIMERIGYSRAYIKDALMRLYWTEADGPKADDADIILRLINEASRDRTTKKLADIMPSIGPAVKILVDKFDLEIST
jgi:hypothetical protein